MGNTSYRVGGIYAGSGMIACLLAGLGCAHTEPEALMRLEPHEKTCEVIIKAPAAVGDMRLWVPEAIMSNTGASACYPVGEAWQRDGDQWTHHVDEKGLLGPGNVNRVDANTLECVGIRFPQDRPVTWQTTLRAKGDAVAFTIDLKNRGDRTIEKAAAAICLKFLAAPWWSDDHVYVMSGGAVRTLTGLGREAGATDSFQAYMLRGESYDNVFYHQFWGINRHTLDIPLMISENSTAGVCVGIESDRAYFLHSNKGNPCTDIMLAFGDVAPGASAEASGRVWVREGKADGFLRARVRSDFRAAPIRKRFCSDVGFLEELTVAARRATALLTHALREWRRR